MLNIMFAELIEGNYVLYQGDLSTNRFVVGKSMGAESLGLQFSALVVRILKIGKNAASHGVQARL
ncbi:hypothetical protein ACIPL1_17275 [Pseudomonas sp. NPDC090202]|uniref:hypothetical protein n=1 Tax=unclassified Pseudomonas TaxID=196821 RepID=UPI003823E0D9